MPDLTVIDAGVSSVQGLGRYGLQRYGIAPGGAMDRMGLAEANALVGQSSGAAAIEVGTFPLRLRVMGGAVRLAATGAQRSILLNDRKVPMRTSFITAEGDVLKLTGAQTGQFSYLAVEGGVRGATEADPQQEGAKQSPFAKRSWILKAGDRLAATAANDSRRETQLPIRKTSLSPIRVVLGPQLECFTPAAITQFLSTKWFVSHAANRMGYLLDGARLPPYKGASIISDGTVTGNIQIAGNGQPLAIMCDRGTVGGYPKIATIITADLGRFAQLAQSGQLTFEPVSVLEAQVAARDFAVQLANVKPGLKLAGPDEFCLASLLACNIAGDAVNAMDGSPNDQQWINEPPQQHLNA
jgi:5-oxoprolinase (ATP-hydrolysing) subunit C